MKSKAYVYTELQISVPFADAPWADINEKLLKQPGFVNKTWLAGTTNNSLGGLYTFETIADAQTFVNGPTGGSNTANNIDLGGPDVDDVCASHHLVSSENIASAL